VNTMSRRAFSLIELLVVVAIICVLVALLLPLLSGLKGNAMRVACASNLRQVALVCQSYAMDSRGHLPQANSDNPGTFKFTVGALMDRFMRDNQIPPLVWYCPVLKNPLMTPAQWMSHATQWNPFNEFPIGYFYVGNPSLGSMFKFVKPVPTTVNNTDRNVELIFDNCSTTRPSPGVGSLVKEWSTFPHFGASRPNGLQVLNGDFSLEYRRKNDVTIGYRFIAPVDMYW
jgi:prepilin-type N-terminal cleavage/methylation domain-containing protein